MYKKKTSQRRKNIASNNRKNAMNKRCWSRLILTCDNAACDWCSLLMAVYHWLDAVGVLHPRSQAGNVNTPRVRGHVSGGFSALTGSYCQLKR